MARRVDTDCLLRTAYKETTLPQQNIALARPANFHYLKCQLDRAQYQVK